MEMKFDHVLPKVLAIDVELKKKLEFIWQRTADCSETFSDEIAFEMLSRFAWARVCEPGDSIVGSIIRKIGSGFALEMFISDSSGKQLIKALCEQGEVTAQQIYKSCEKWSLRLNRSATEGDIDTALARGGGVLLPGAKYWPERLNDLETHSPVMLWTQGNHRLLGLRSLSVVGARAVSSYGSHVTAEMVQTAVELGSAIVSGGAFGVDAIAHRTALALEAPTVAVVAGGIDRCYPAAHSNLFTAIEQSGLVCAENVPGTAPTRWRFLMRNRIIAACSPATLITEAGRRSGSLNTAGHAAQLGRSLGAVPGPITTTGSQGCHYLIKEYGAELISDSSDIPALLGLSSADQARAVTGLRPVHASGEGRELSLHARVMDALPLRGKRSVMEIAKHAGLTARETMNSLAELSLLGAVASVPHPTRGKIWGFAKRVASET